MSSKLTGVILAGGHSQRMGVPKHNIPLWDNRSMLTHVVENMAPLVSHILLSLNVNLNLQTTVNTTIVRDLRSDCGPISGIEAALNTASSPMYLIVSCDQPLLSTQLLAQLIKKMVPETYTFFSSASQGHLTPFPGIFPQSCLPELQDHITQGQYGLRKLLASTKRPINWVSIDDMLVPELESINTPEQLRRVIELRGTL